MSKMSPGYGRVKSNSLVLGKMCQCAATVTKLQMQQSRLSAETSRRFWFVFSYIWSAMSRPMAYDSTEEREKKERPGSGPRTTRSLLCLLRAKTEKE